MAKYNEEKFKLYKKIVHFTIKKKAENKIQEKCEINLGNINELIESNLRILLNSIIFDPL